MMKGIDISDGSGVNFVALKNAGYDFVIARAGWGSAKTDRQIDRDFHNNVMGAIAAGLHIGAYWFIYARSVPEAQENAMRFAETLEPYKGLLDMPVYIDYEYDSTRYYNEQTENTETKDFVTTAISVAAAQMEHFGYFTGVYLNPDYIKNHVFFDDLTHFSLWLAEWKSPETKPSYDCAMWQYAGDSELPGIASGAVDLNTCYKDFPKIIKDAGMNGFHKTNSPVYSIYGKPIQIFENGTWRFAE